MQAQELKQLVGIIHDESPILIKVGDKLFEVRELRRLANYEGRVCHAFIPVDVVIETK